MLSTRKFESHRRRRLRIRNKISGTTERPRLCVHKSGRHLYAQVVDDSSGRTVAMATTNTKAHKDSPGAAKSFANLKMAAVVGREVADKAKAAGVTKVVFDRGGHAYHGIVKAIAEAAREAGLQF